MSDKDEKRIIVLEKKEEVFENPIDKIQNEIEKYPPLPRRPEDDIRDILLEYLKDES